MLLFGNQSKANYLVSKINIRLIIVIKDKLSFLRMDNYYGVDSSYTCYNCNRVYNVSRYSICCPVCGQHNTQKIYRTPQQWQHVKFKQQFYANYNPNHKQRQRQLRELCIKCYLCPIVFGIILVIVGLLLIVVSLMNQNYSAIIYGGLMLLCAFILLYCGKKFFDQKNKVNPSNNTIKSQPFIQEP